MRTSHTISPPAPVPGGGSRPTFLRFLGTCTCLLPLTFAVACGGTGEGPDGTGEGLDDTGDDESEALINGKPASEYYGQFVWEEFGGHIGGAAAFAEENERNAYVVDFFLLDDKSFKLFYAEGFGDVTATGYSLGVFPDSKRKREGTWSIEDATLHLGSIMTCDAITFNGDETMQCELNQSIETSAAVGAGNIMRRQNDSSPFDSEWADYN